VHDFDFTVINDEASGILIYRFCSCGLAYRMAGDQWKMVEDDLEHSHSIRPEESEFKPIAGFGRHNGK
jgi:hypothetical protein